MDSSNADADESRICRRVKCRYASATIPDRSTRIAHLKNSATHFKNFANKAQNDM